MAKIHGPSKIQAISKMQATLAQRERFNTHQVGHGQYDGNKVTDDFDTELLRYTPFKKEELFAITNTDKWNDPLNVERLIATFPTAEFGNFDDATKKFTETLVSEQPKNLTFPARRLAALFQRSRTGISEVSTAYQSADLAYLSLMSIGVNPAKAAEVSKYIRTAGKNDFQQTQDFYDLDECKDPDQMIEYSDSFKDAYLKNFEKDPRHNMSYEHADLDVYRAYMENRIFREELMLNGFPQNELFTQKNAFSYHHMPMSPDTRPTQGMMLFIRCSDKSDYENQLQIITRDLIECGADFMIAAPKGFDTVFDETGNSWHKGKCITLFEGPWNAREFFARNPELLSDTREGIDPYGSMQLAGRITGRYGSFVDDTMIDPVTCIEYFDELEEWKPVFVTGFTIYDFIDACEGKDVDIIHSAILQNIADETNREYEDLKIGQDETGELYVYADDRDHIADLREDGTYFIDPEPIVKEQDAENTEDPGNENR